MARYQMMKAAMNAHDEDTIKALLAPGFRSVELSGKTMTADEMTDLVMRLPADPNRTSHTDFLSTKPVGDEVVVEQLYRMQTKKTGADGKTHVLGLTAPSSDKWRKIHAQWFCLFTATNETWIQLGWKGDPAQDCRRRMKLPCLLRQRCPVR